MLFVSVLMSATARTAFVRMLMLVAMLVAMFVFVAVTVFVFVFVFVTVLLHSLPPFLCSTCRSAISSINLTCSSAIE